MTASLSLQSGVHSSCPALYWQPLYPSLQHHLRLFNLNTVSPSCSPTSSFISFPGLPTCMAALRNHSFSAILVFVLVSDYRLSFSPFLPIPTLKVDLITSWQPDSSLAIFAALILGFFFRGQRTMNHSG